MILHVLNNLIDFVLPPRCAGCQRLGDLICGPCLAALSSTVPPLCLDCGGEGVQRCICPKQKAVDIDRFVFSPFGYRAPLPKIIHAFKYSNQFALARPLGRLLHDYMCQLGWDQRPVPPLIVPIPLHPQRQRERGYNQSALLAHQLGKCSGWPIKENLLQRPRATRAQARLSAAERRKNVAGAFVVATAPMARCEVILLDDVCTTGSTLRAAADVLRAAGMSTVAGLCVARAVDQNSTITPQIGKNV